MELPAAPRHNMTMIDTLLSRIKPVGNVMLVASAVKNWYDIVFFKLGLKKEVDLSLRNGETKHVGSKDDYYRFMNTDMDWAISLSARLDDKITVGRNILRVKFNGRVVKLYYDSRPMLGSSVYLAQQQFLNHEYGELDVEGKVVIDIGASIADSPIYFCLSGAKHVYAFEPFPRTYRIAKKNIALNGLGKKITLMNMAVVPHAKVVYVDSASEINIDNMAGGQKRRVTHGKGIIGLSLEDIVAGCGIDGGVLKMDCEGCEYGSILGASNDVLQHFDQIAIEYHYGYKDLEQKLKGAGFSVRHTIPKYAGYYRTREPIMYIGLIFAKRNVPPKSGGVPFRNP